VQNRGHVPSGKLPEETFAVFSYADDRLKQFIDADRVVWQQQQQGWAGPSGSSGPAWGGGGGAGMSLRQIQEEEARQRAADPQQQQSGNSWANRAAGPGGLSQPPPQSARAAAPAAVPAPAVVPPAPVAQHEEELFWDYPKAPKEDAAKSKGTSKTLSKAQTTQLEKWMFCELEKLTGTNDTTLGEFLLSLHSASEVKEYAEEYLGAPGKAFAEELVFRKQMDVEVVQSKKKSDSTSGSAGAKKDGGFESIWEDGVLCPCIF
jgi:hypothetical protein